MFITTLFHAFWGSILCVFVPQAWMSLEVSLTFSLSFGLLSG